MEGDDELAECFEQHRPRLRAVAHRMLGSASEADDAVQESWLRLSRSATEDVANLGAWLTTVTARVCLDMLRARSTGRAQSGSLVHATEVSSRDRVADPADDAVLADTVGLALLVVLDALKPPERLAFVLHDMFAAVRRHSADHRVLPGGGAPARQPGPPPSARRHAACRRPSRPAGDRRRLPEGLL